MTDADDRHEAELTERVQCWSRDDPAPLHEVAFLLRRLTEVRAAHDHQRKVSEAGAENLREMWTSLRMVRDAVEELGPVGAVRTLDCGPPNPIGEAEAIIGGIQMLAAHERRVADLLVANNALLERARVAEDRLRWRSIETAPKDGSTIDVWLGDAEQADREFYCVPGTRYSSGWHWFNGKFRPAMGLHVPVFTQPTHWRPLPEPPHD